VKEEPRPPARADAGRLALLGAAWAALFLACDPRGAFPLNDDFQYAECARRLLAGEGFHPPDWALSWAAPHAALGALMTAPWGASNQALRLWMLCVGACGAAGVYALARRWRAGEDAALLAALTLALSPLYAALSASFHLDVTAAVLTLAALGAFLRGRETGSARWLAASSVLIGLSGLTRQTGFLCAAGGAAALALERRLTVFSAAALLAPALLLGGGFEVWLRVARGPSWAWASGAYAGSPLTDWARLAFWRTVLERLSQSVQMGALFLLPLAIPRARDALRRPPSRGEAAALAAVAAAAAWGWAAARGLPLIQNTLHHNGLGVVTLMGSGDKPGGWWSGPWLWNAAALLALASSLVLVRAAAEDLRGPSGAERRAAALFVGAPFAAVLAVPVMYDRYLLMILPAAAAAFAAGRRETAVRLAPAFAAAAVLGLLTTAGLADYFSWNRARWEAGMAAVAHGVPPERVEDGFDWDGQFTLTRNLAALRATRPAREIGIWDWQALNRVVAGTTFSEAAPLPGWVLVGRFPYRTPLTRAGGAVRLYAAPELVTGKGALQPSRAAATRTPADAAKQ
jgi:hypothetical protein